MVENKIGLQIAVLKQKFQDNLHYVQDNLCFMQKKK